jgi:hypothetical protein
MLTTPPVCLCDQVDPKNEATWSSWIQMEEDLGRLEAANELRIRSSEQQWEFVIPATFSTRSGGSSGADSSSSGLLQSLMGTLNSFFSLRGSGTGSGSIGSNGGSNGGRGMAVGRQQLMAELLPPDYRADLSLNDVMYEAAALEAGSSSSSGGSSNGGTATTGTDTAVSTSGGRQDAAQQQQQAEWSADAGSSSSRSFGAAGSRVGGRSEQLLDKQQRLDRAAGLQRRPSRPPSSNWK